MIKRMLSPTNLPVRERGSAFGGSPSPYSDNFDQTVEQQPHPENEARLVLHPYPSGDRLLASFIPPKAPEWFTPSGPKRDMPNDIVLVIDCSVSMSAPAKGPKPANESSCSPSDAHDEPQLRLIGLVKKAAKAIIETMGPGDRLGIVTFATAVKTIQTLTPMDGGGKASTRQNIGRIDVGGCTNLWGGLARGLGLFQEKREYGLPPRAATRTLMLLTDGMPNHGEPSRGYIPQLGKVVADPGYASPTIHTFGFGTRLRSGLLKSIAEMGDGNFSYIPDEGMLGTVFVNAVANLQAMMVPRATLRLEYDEDVLEIGYPTALGKGVKKPDRRGCFEIELGPVQWGQSRDVPIEVKFASGVQVADAADRPLVIKAEVQYYTTKGKVVHASADLRAPSRNRNLLAYHAARARLCSILSSFFPYTHLAEHHEVNGPGKPPVDGLERIQELIAETPSNSGDEDLEALRQDLVGQVRLALQKDENENDNSNNNNNGGVGGSSSSKKGSPWNVWGRHYLLSLWNAHASQVCNNFKDPGPGRYGLQSPLFLRSRDELDDKYMAMGEVEDQEKDYWTPGEDLMNPAAAATGYNTAGRGAVWSNAASAGITRFPDTARMQREPGYDKPGHEGGRRKWKVDMRRYHDPSNGCFAEDTTVVMDGGILKRIDELRGGDVVTTPNGPRRVEMVLKFRYEGELVVLPNAVRVTPWHPVRLWQKYSFPCEVEGATREVYSSHVYTALLERDADVESHALRLLSSVEYDMSDNGVWGVTLGHGLLLTGKGENREAGKTEDARAHNFFGDYHRISEECKGLSEGRDGSSALLIHGVRRGVDGKICGYLL